MPEDLVSAGMGLMSPDDDARRWRGGAERAWSAMASVMCALDHKRVTVLPLLSVVAVHSPGAERHGICHVRAGS